MITLPYKRIAIPGRNPVTVTADAVRFDLSAFFTKPDPDYVVTYKRAKDGSIAVDVSQKLLAEAATVASRQTIMPANVAGLLRDETYVRAFLSPMRVLDVSICQVSGLQGAHGIFLNIVLDHLKLSTTEDQAEMHPYDTAVTRAVNQVALGLRQVFIPARKKERSKWLWKEAFDTFQMSVFNWAVRVPELVALCERSQTMRHLVNDVLRHGRAVVSSPYLRTLPAILGELCLPFNGSIQRDPRKMTKAELEQLLAFIESDLHPQLKRGELYSFYQHWLGPRLDIPAIQALLVAEPDMRPALQAIFGRIASKTMTHDVRTSTHHLHYLLAEPAYRAMIRSAATHRVCGVNRMMTAFLDSSYASPREAWPTTDTMPFTTYLAQALQKYLLVDHLGRSQLQLASTTYRDRVPKSEQIKVDLLGGTEEYARDLVESGAFFMGVGRDFQKGMQEYKHKTTRYVARVSDNATGRLIGYLFLTDYFKTNFSWTIHEDDFRAFYGKIRYRVSVCRRQTRILEELDLDL